MTTMEYMETRRLGFVYVLERADLRVCYVGQSVREHRPAMHLRPGTYQYDELHAGGGVPVTTRTESLFEYGQDLDEAERAEMRARVAAGWKLVNRLGPDASWPMVPFESASAGGKKGGKAMWVTIREKVESDPEWRAMWGESKRKGAAAVQARRLADPEFDKAYREASTAGFRKGNDVWRELLRTDPEYQRRATEAGRAGGLAGGRSGGKATAKVRVQCLECGKISTPGGTGSHQKSSGHVGRETVSES